MRYLGGGAQYRHFFPGTRVIGWRTAMRKLLLLIPMLAATAAIPDLAQLQKMIARFQPTELRVDVSKLSPGDRQALAKLVEAARVLNDIFLTQMWGGNHATYAKLRQDTTPLD